MKKASSDAGVHLCKRGCEFDSHSHSILFAYLIRFALVSRQSAAFSSAAQNAMTLEFGGEWGAECLNSRLHLPTLIHTD